MGLKPRTKTEGPKTTPTRVDPDEFISALDDRRQAECNAVVEMMTELTGEKPTMWGPSIVGFGQYHYKYASGREGDWPRTGFSPRKAGLTLYCMPGFKEQTDLLAKLGPHKTSVSCLNIKRLEQVDQDVLRKIIKRSLTQMTELYGP